LTCRSPKRSRRLRYSTDFFGSRSSSEGTSACACAIGLLLLPPTQPPKLTPCSPSARHPPFGLRHPPSAICHLPLATHHSSGGTRWTRVVQFSGSACPIPRLFRAPAFMTATQVHLAQANHHGALATCHPPYRTPSSATRNKVHFACMIPYKMLRFPGFLKISAGLVFVASQSSATTCIHVSLDSGGQRS
jgi:hypothetical protein